MICENRHHIRYLLSIARELYGNPIALAGHSFDRNATPKEMVGGGTLSHSLSGPFVPLYM